MSEYSLIKINTARNALRYIIRAFNIKELYFPYYICPALRISAQKEHCKLIFYHIDLNFKPLQEFPPESYILYPNYFGVCEEIILELEQKYPNLIVDNAHSFFSEPKGIAAFSSLRKFFPKLQDGAFLYTTKSLNSQIVKDDFQYKYEKLTYEALCKNENRLDREEIKTISDCTLNYFLKLNLNEQKQKFLDNFIENHKIYGTENKLKLTIKNNSIPFAYPYLAKTTEIADCIVKELECKNKMIFRYWNNLPDDFPEKILYTNLIVIQ